VLDYRVSFLKSARRDISHIRRFIEANSGSARTAARIIDRIFDRCDRIGRIPFGGRPRDDLQLGLRTVPFEDKAVIAYRVEKNRVLIVRVFYAGRDWETVLLTKMPGTSAPPEVYPPDRD
jgi:toxin ParE1/3/4